MANSSMSIERIFQILKSKGITVASFERELDLSNGYLARTRSRNADIGEILLRKILDKFPDIEPVWLISGMGEMYREGFFEKKSSIRIPTEKVGSRKLKAIPLIPIEALAGSTPGDQSVLEAECELYEIPEFKSADFLIRLSGDSMFPTYKSGDLIACQRITDASFIQWGRVFVLDTTQGAICKRVFEGPDSDSLKIVSENAEKYPPFLISRKDVRTLSIVNGVIRRD
jgi:repressor LexA